MTRNSYGRKKNEHHATVLCECGCGQYFDAIYTTKKPQYASLVHKRRVHNATRKGQRAAKYAELLKTRKRCIKLARQHIKDWKVQYPALFNRDEQFTHKLEAALCQRLIREVMAQR